MMKTLYIAAAVSLLFLCSCGKKKQQYALDMPVDSIVVDTIAYQQGLGSPQCNIHINFKYFSDKHTTALNETMLKETLATLTGNDSLPVDSSLQAIISQVADHCSKTYQRTIGLITLQENGDKKQLSWRYAVDTDIQKWTSDHILLLAHVSCHEGGEGASEYTMAKNIEAQSGRILALADLYDEQERNKLKDKIVRALARQQHCSGLEGLREKGFLIDTEPYLTDNFILTDADVTFIYVPGEIAPVKEGEISVSIDR